ncbi:MAG: hypothetical protein PVF83_06470 [Anaerolineales bacterium]|jgi:hypothetical protein
MKKKRKEIILGSFAVLLILSTVLPVQTTAAEPALPHSFDDTVLLMLSSHAYLEPFEVAMAENRKAVPLRQTPIQSPLEILIKLYADEAKKAQERGLVPAIQETLRKELEVKIDALKAKEERRQTPSLRLRGRRTWLGRLTNFIGRVLGRVMDGGKEIIRFGVEEVAPRVFHDVILAGQPVTSAVVKKITGNILLQRVRNTLGREIEMRISRIITSLEAASEAAEIDETQPVTEETQEPQIAQDDDGDDGQPEPQPVIEETQAPESAQDDDGDDGQPETVQVYEFTTTDNVFYNEPILDQENMMRIGNMTWSDMGEKSDYHCNSGSYPLSTATLHIELDFERMVVSGWVEAQAVGNYKVVYAPEGKLEFFNDVNGWFKVTFEDLPLTPVLDSADVLYTYEGTGTADAALGGLLTCYYWDDTSLENVYVDVNDQTSKQTEIKVSGYLYSPEAATCWGWGNLDYCDLYFTTAHFPSDDTLHFGINFGAQGDFDFPAP